MQPCAFQWKRQPFESPKVGQFIVLPQIRGKKERLLKREVCCSSSLDVLQSLGRREQRCGAWLLAGATPPHPTPLMCNRPLTHAELHLATLQFEMEKNGFTLTTLNCSHYGLQSLQHSSFFPRTGSGTIFQLLPTEQTLVKLTFTTCR